eukprot:scaffold49383_cov27-Tisochrysis_lutea.AAC.7
MVATISSSASGSRVQSVARKRSSAHVLKHVDLLLGAGQLEVLHLRQAEKLLASAKLNPPHLHLVPEHSEARQPLAALSRRDAGHSRTGGLPLVSEVRGVCCELLHAPYQLRLEPFLLHRQSLCDSFRLLEQSLPRDRKVGDRFRLLAAHTVIVPCEHAVHNLDRREVLLDDALAVT